MSDKPPEFSSGNKWMVRALNSVVKFALVHGVNPAGIPGWSQTTDGWQPPRIRPSAIAGSDPWDISKTTGENGLTSVSVAIGTILKSSDSISTALSCINETDTFEADAGGFIGIKFDLSLGFDIDDYEIVYSDSWFVASDKTVDYNGTVGADDFEVLAAYFPLYKFVAAAEDGSVPISDGVHAVRLCERENLRMVAIYFRDSADNSRFLYPGVEVGPKAA